jgi:hypothetical protein
VFPRRRSRARATAKGVSFFFELKRGKAAQRRWKPLRGLRCGSGLSKGQVRGGAGWYGSWSWDDEARP